MNYDILLFLNFIPMFYLMYECMMDKGIDLFADVSKQK